MRTFELHRDIDVSGISGEGIVAEGVVFGDGTVALRWRSEWPTSVVFHDRGLEGLIAVHGHGGATRIVWLNEAVAESRQPRDINGPCSACGFPSGKCLDLALDDADGGLGACCGKCDHPVVAE